MANKLVKGARSTMGMILSNTEASLDVSQLTVFSKKANPKVIDWDSCVQLCGGREQDAKDILVLCAKDLLQSRQAVKAAYEQHNTRKLRDELHRVTGGLCYLKLPELTRAVNEFYSVVREEPQNELQLELTHLLFQEAARRFCECVLG